MNDEVNGRIRYEMTQFGLMRVDRNDPNSGWQARDPEYAERRRLIDLENARFHEIDRERQRIRNDELRMTRYRQEQERRQFDEMMRAQENINMVNWEKEKEVKLELLKTLDFISFDFETIKTLFESIPKQVIIEQSYELLNNIEGVKEQIQDLKYKQVVDLLMKYNK